MMAVVLCIWRYLKCSCKYISVFEKARKSTTVEYSLKNHTLPRISAFTKYLLCVLWLKDRTKFRGRVYDFLCGQNWTKFSFRIRCSCSKNNVISECLAFQRRIRNRFLTYINLKTSYSLIFLCEKPKVVLSFFIHVQSISDPSQSLAVSVSYECASSLSHGQVIMARN